MTRKTKPGAASRRAARIKERRVFPAGGSNLTPTEYAKKYYSLNFPATPDMHLKFITVNEVFA